jgi:hypothetical protein
MELKFKSAIERKKRYVPEWNGNRELPAGDQFYINFKYLPGSSEVGNYVSGNKIDFKQFLFDCVGKIGNLNINGETIENGVALSQALYPELTSLFIELLNYVFPSDDIDEGESGA